MNNPELKEFINRHKHLFWYTAESDKENISKELLLETILNYAELDTIKELFSLLGLEEAARIFHGAKGRKKLNYYPEVYNFFYLYFKNNVHRDS